MDEPRATESRQLGMTETQYRALVEEIPLILYTELKDADETRYYISPQIEQVLGYTPTEYSSWSWDDFYRIVHPDDVELLRTANAEFRAGAAATTEYRLIARDGRAVWFRDVAVAEENGDRGEIVRGYLVDITESRVAEEALRRRDAVLEGVAAAAQLLVERPVEEAATEALAVLGRALGVGRCTIVEIGECDGVPVAVSRFAWASDTSRTVRVGTQVPLCGLERWLGQLAAGQPLQGITQLLPARERGWLEARGVRSVVAVPILIGSELWGALAFHELAEERTWPAAEVDALQAAAGLVGAGVARADAERALRSSEELRQRSQRIEAIGRLAGGVAHDFNNLLTVIRGYSAQVLEHPPLDERAREDVRQVVEAADRAALLTQQLLTFARQETPSKEAVDLNRVVEETASMLARLIGEDIEMRVELEPGLPPVVADDGQLQQVVVNLAVNARDAMPDGGTLTISTGLVDDGERPGPPLVGLVVSDTGDGIPDDVRPHLFEPFFTTKHGRGTGLGLATVHGIACGLGGDVVVESVPSRGATFTVLLPAARAVEGAGGARAQATDDGVGTETILLAEDEEAVRALVVRMLEQRGYSVLVAGDGAEALRLGRESATRVDLLVTDVVMPHLGGRELAERIRASRPDLPVLFLSGYADERADITSDTVVGGAHLLQKPFSAAALGAAVRAALEAV